MKQKNIRMWKLIKQTEEETFQCMSWTCQLQQLNFFYIKIYEFSAVFLIFVHILSFLWIHIREFLLLILLINKEHVLDT